jgi:hypothetical protein
MILLNQREISISIANAKSMKITLLSINGKKIANKNVSGDSVSFVLPKASKKAIIIQIIADGKLFSQKVMLE